MTDTETPVLRRLYPGSRLESTFAWPWEPLDALESSFNVQEYLQQLIRSDKSNVTGLVDLPEGVDKEVWQYEHLRQVCLELSLLVVALESECTKENCPEMKADGWLYLCAAHPSTQSCPAIDYIIHTLDGATLLLNNSKYFPSRISVPELSLKHFQSIARRLYRIFAHAYYHHREIYETFENETSLYARFLLLSQVYELIPASLVSIPDSTSKTTTDEQDSMSEGTKDSPLSRSAILVNKERSNDEVDKDSSEHEGQQIHG
ncbi:MOB member 4, phocein [Apophysomyces sp. BC1034]|nr:MOB member 4, phocein [Apophysomyces sp. BC1015]KAG0179656.1 MOB member 4, phocein [Apophysomyces sp. BC1021]KAG0189987.1 MOB member 4, phocein [Apophysomyces sp. BC1034]